MHPFDQDIAVTRQETGVLTGNVSDNWSINDNPNGGYLMALLASAMLEVGDKGDTPILTVNYMAICKPGDVELQVEEISCSRSFCRLEARLIQEGEEKVRGLGTFSGPVEDCFIRCHETPAPKIAPREKCIQIPRMPKFTLYDHMDVRLDPICAGWTENRMAEKSEHRGWIAFRDDRPWDICSVALATDAFPPAVFATQGMLAWVPTIELSINIRSIPTTRWLRCIFRTRFITCGLLEEDGEIWDETGALVAISRQIAQFRKPGA